jgi:hypothetical protein
MNDPGEAVISGSDWRELLSACNRIVPGLPPELRRRFVSIRSAYLAAYGIEGLYERLNGRTVSQVLEEYEQPKLPPVIASGEVDGVRFTLYEAPRIDGDAV